VTSRLPKISSGFSSRFGDGPFLGNRMHLFRVWRGFNGYWRWR
jgi:hypothetical protein